MTPAEACRSKVRYPGRKRASNRALVSGRKTGRKLYTYRCPECNGWHLTSVAPTAAVTGAATGA